jgi:hypothetical protein
MILPFRNNPLTIKSGSESFTPQGVVKVNPLSKSRLNPIKADYIKAYGPSIAARLFVGLSDLKGNKYTMSKLVTLTRSFLRLYGAPEDSSFLSQSGVYTHKSGRDAGKVVTEKSAQIIIIKMDGEKTLSRFQDLVVGLSEEICRKMNQESVIIDLQRNGVSKHIWEVVK